MPSNQARRQSSVTGGEGIRKVFEGALINFTLIFGSEDQKKVFNLAIYLLSEHKSRAGGGGARRNLMGVRISLLAH